MITVSKVKSFLIKCISYSFCQTHKGRHDQLSDFLEIRIARNNEHYVLQGIYKVTATHGDQLLENVVLSIESVAEPWGNGGCRPPHFPKGRILRFTRKSLVYQGDEGGGVAQASSIILTCS